MSLYQKIKSAITVRQVGEMYGMEPDRHGMVCCPFHSDNHPSMKLNDTYYYCFGCGANGDAIDLTAKLFDLNPRQAAEKLINDFAFAKQCSPQWGLQVTERSCVSKMERPRPDKLWLDPDKPPANAIALLPPKRGLTDEQWADIAYCLRVLTDYLDLLHDWQERYKPASPEEPLDERFVEALHTTETIEHLTDCVAFGTPQQKAAAAAQLLSGSYLLMLEGFFKPWVMRFFRGGRLVALLPVVQQVEIISQHPQTVGDVCPLLVCQAALGRQSDGIGGRLVRVKPEVVYQLLGGLPWVQVEQLGGEVDGISVGSAAKAVIIGVVQLHAGVAVRMERTAHHAMAVGLHAVHLSHLPNGDGELDSLIQAQGHSSFVSCVAPETPKWELWCFLLPA